MVERRPQSFNWDVSESTQAGAYEAYRDSFSDLYDVAGVDDLARRNFTSRTSVTLFRAGVIAHGRSAGQTLIRTPERIRRSGIGSLNLTLVHSRMAGDSDGRSVSSAGGTIHLQDMSRPSISRWESLHIVNLTVPRERISHWFTGGDIHGSVLNGAAGAGRLIAHHLKAFADVAPELTEAEGEAAIQAAILIVERALGRETLASTIHADAIRRTVRETAIRFIGRNLLSPGLSVETIARACAVSRSTLYRAFDGQGGVAGQIQRMRLDGAREALQQRHASRRTITDIAFDHGFASQAHFSRAYRARFGHSPSEEPSACGSHPAASARAPGDIRHDRVADWLQSGL